MLPFHHSLRRVPLYAMRSKQLTTVGFVAMLWLFPIYLVTACFQGWPDMTFAQWMKHNGITKP
jgi:hypothetical protein